MIEMITWLFVGLIMLVPALFELFAAFRLFAYRKETAGLNTFNTHFWGGLIWAALGMLVLYGAVMHTIHLTLPWFMSSLLIIVLANYRVSAGLESLWVAGLLSENLFMKIAHTKKKIG